MSLPRVLAVDCGAGHVACGQFAADKSGRLQLTKLSYDTFNPDPALDAEWLEAIAQNLGDEVKRDKVGGETVLGLPGHHILGKFIKIPTVEESKRAKIVQFEAQQNIPYGLHEVVWDYEVVSEHGLDLELMLAAVKREIADGACATLSAAGLAARSVVPSSVAVLRCFRHNYPEVTGSVIVADIGARSTNLIFADATRFFVRTIPLAGNSITQSIAEELKHDFTHCETIKLQVLEGTSELPPASPIRAAVQNAVAGFYSKLHLELTRSIVNYRRQSGAEQPVALYVTGGGSRLSDIAEKLAEKLKVSVERLDPFRAIEVSAPGAADHAPVVAGLVGLALPSAKGRKSINLLPPAIAERIAFSRRQPVLLAAAALGTLAFTAVLVQSFRLKAAAEEQLSGLTSAVFPLETVKTKINSRLQSLEEAREQVLAVQSLAESKNNWINFFSDLQTRLVAVEDVWLESLQVIRAGTTPAAGGDALFGGNPEAAPAPVDPANPDAKPALKLQLSGRLLDRKNPVSNVSPDAYERVKTLLASFVDSQFISAVERESFDSTTPGILRFDFILVIDPARPL